MHLQLRRQLTPGQLVPWGRLAPYLIQIRRVFTELAKVPLTPLALVMVRAMLNSWLQK
jgi:hypothetical protein